MTETRWLSVAEAATVLGVSARRVRQLLDAGDLEAEQIGGRAVLDSASVHRRAQHRPPPGRPLSPELAWAFLASLSPAPAGSAEALLSLAVDRRLRHRLVRLLARPHSSEEWRQLLRRRAESHRYWAHPGIVNELLADPHVSAGRARAAATYGLDVSPGDESVAYVARPDLAALEARYVLEPDGHGRLELLVYDDYAYPGGPRPGRPVPIGAAVIDMLDTDDARLQAEAQRWLAVAGITLTDASSSV